MTNNETLNKKTSNEETSNEETFDEETLDIEKAARFLKMSIAGLYRKASKLGRKTGKRWCFYKPRLINYLNGLEDLDSGSNAPCLSINAAKKVSIKSVSQPPMESEYESLLGLTTVNKRKN